VALKVIEGELVIEPPGQLFQVVMKQNKAAVGEAESATALYLNASFT
jgi:hypothetical protein